MDNFWLETPQLSGGQAPSSKPHDTQDIKESGLLDMALFEIKADVLVENPGLNRSVSVTLGETAGAMRLLVPDTLMLGNFPSSGDERGCVISRKTAESLYSSREALGESLSLNGKDYMVRGILDRDAQLCLIQGGRDVSYSNLCVDAPGLPLSAAQQQLAGLLSLGAAVVSEGSLYRGIGGVFLWLPAWGLLFYFTKITAPLYRKTQTCFAGKPWGALLFTLLGQLRFILSFGAGCWILLVSLHFSDDYVPTAWSDFSFWTELFAQKSRSILILIKEPLLHCDLRMLGSLGGVVTLAVVETLLLILWFRQSNRGSYLPPAIS